MKGDWHLVLGSQRKIVLELEKTLSFSLQPVVDDSNIDNGSPGVYLLKANDGKITVGQLELLKRDPLGRVAFRFQSITSSDFLDSTSLSSDLTVAKVSETFELFNRLRFAYPIGLNQLLLQGDEQLSLMFEKKSQHFRYSGCVPI